MASISHLAIYPVKGCGGIEVKSALLTPSGLMIEGYADHEYMLVHSKPDNGVYKFASQRDAHGGKPQALAKMATIRPYIGADNFLHITHDGDDITIPYLGDDNEETGRFLPVKIHDEDPYYALDQGDMFSQWFSDHLGADVRLVKAPAFFSRKARQNYVSNENPLRFQDGYPVHWFSEESLAELSQRAKYDIPWQTFRPQLVVKGMQPGDEHIYNEGMVGHVRFINAKPCDRCPVTNVDQATGEVMVGRALRPLASYKKWRNNSGGVSVIFGENMLPLDSRLIHAGNPVYLVTKRDPPIVYGTSV